MITRLAETPPAGPSPTASERGRPGGSSQIQSAIQIPQVVWVVPRGLKRTAKADQSPVVPSLASLQHGLIKTLLVNLVALTKSLIPSLPYTMSFYFFFLPLRGVVISNIVICSLNDGTDCFAVSRCSGGKSLWSFEEFRWIEDVFVLSLSLWLLMSFLACHGLVSHCNVGGTPTRAGVPAATAAAVHVVVG